MGMPFLLLLSVLPSVCTGGAQTTLPSLPVGSTDCLVLVLTMSQTVENRAAHTALMARAVVGGEGPVAVEAAAVWSADTGATTPPHWRHRPTPIGATGGAYGAVCGGFRH